jgi:hypothetical protein
MEMRFNLTLSNDPRFITKIIKGKSCILYFANYYTKIIKDGLMFNDELIKGKLINYNNNITIIEGEFQKDKPINKYTEIIGENIYMPHNKTNHNNHNKKQLFYCDAVIYNCEITKTHNKKTFIKDIILQIIVENGMLLTCDIFKGIYNIHEYQKHIHVFNNNWYYNMPYFYHSSQYHNFIR